MKHILRLLLVLTVCLGLPMLLACAGAGANLSGAQNQVEEAKIDAASLDADKYCPDEWRAAEMMVRHSERLMQSQQYDLARATLQEALRLYRQAAECAANRKRERRMPAPVPGM
ncbi:MAG TPA: hypothetical protein PKW95_16580 [bacterium]|nr:hypothetical protein [bacterium]